MTNEPLRASAEKKLDALADDPSLDAGVAALSGLTDQLAAVGIPGFKRGERGASEWTPVHPALVHLPLGGVVSALVLDIAGLRRGASLVSAVSLGAAVPTALAGLMDFPGADDQRMRRIAVLHAVAAAFGSSLLGGSLIARARRHHQAGKILLGAATLAYGTAGMIGGHLVYGMTGPDPPQTTGAEAAE